MLLSSKITVKITKLRWRLEPQLYRPRHLSNLSLWLQSCNGYAYRPKPTLFSNLANNVYVHIRTEINTVHETIPM